MEAFDENNMHLVPEYCRNMDLKYDNYCFSLSWFVENGGVGFATYPFGDKNSFVKDVLKNSPYTYSNFSQSLKEQSSTRDGFNNVVALAVNLLA